MYIGSLGMPMQTMMKAMVLEKQGTALTLQTRPIPSPSPGQILLKVKACAVCRTDIHVVDGDLQHPKLPLIPGHEIIGMVTKVGKGVTDIKAGDRVGVPWLGWTCGTCRYCRMQKENLCEKALFTGYTLDGGFAEYHLADARYCFPIPDGYSDIAAAPLMCAGLIGFRAYKMTDGARKIGLYGFGAAAHILTQIAVNEGKDIYAFTKPDDKKAQAFARRLGACWSGGSDESPPTTLNAAILFAPIGSLVPKALTHIDKAGVVVCAGIHMSDIPSFPYRHLWEERIIRSVANLTRKDGEAFLKLAPTVPVKTNTHIYSLEQANQALNDLRTDKFEGAAVLAMD